MTTSSSCLLCCWAISEIRKLWMQCVWWTTQQPEVITSCRRWKCQQLWLMTFSSSSILCWMQNNAPHAPVFVCTHKPTWSFLPTTQTQTAACQIVAQAYCCYFTAIPITFDPIIQLNTSRSFTAADKENAHNMRQSKGDYTTEILL